MLTVSFMESVALQVLKRSAMIAGDAHLARDIGIVCIEKLPPDDIFFNMADAKVASYRRVLGYIDSLCDEIEAVRLDPRTAPDHWEELARLELLYEKEFPIVPLVRADITGGGQEAR